MSSASSDPDVSSFSEINGIHHYATSVESNSESNLDGKSTYSSHFPPTKRAIVVEELRPEYIRWMYREYGTKKWVPFIGYDSLRIECKYREMKQSLSRKILSPNSVCDELINVRGGLYEVDVMQMKCLPVYWSSADEVMEVIRGLWFVSGTWQPLEGEFAEIIETEHWNKFVATAGADETEEAKLEASEKKVIHHISVDTCHIKWITEDVVYFYNQKSYSKFYNAISRTLKIVKCGIRIHRGYLHEAKMTDKPPDITHLVFVIHGVGQRMYEGSIRKTCSDFREACQRMMKYIPEFDSDNKRLEFFPVGWRSSLTLDGDTVESITPNKVRDVRTFLNGSAMDVMYYTSPLYRSEIVVSLQKELNRLYEMFLKRQPYFEASGGKVSIAAHSLGAVIVYDIMTDWNPHHLYDLPTFDETSENQSDTDYVSQLQEDLKAAKQKVHDLEEKLRDLLKSSSSPSSALKFKLDCFFTLGSPLALFLALRGLQPGTNSPPNQLISPILCRRIYNIFHPSDPVAFRLEPLLLKHYQSVKPLRIHRHTASDKEPYESISTKHYHVVPPTAKSTSEKTEISVAVDEDEDDDDDDDDDEEEEGKEENNFEGGFGNGSSADLDVLLCESRDSSNSATTNEGRNADANVDCSKSDHLPDDAEKTFPRLEHRIDYMLREGKMESSYLSTLTSHTAYWTNVDVALFILSQIFPEYRLK